MSFVFTGGGYYTSVSLGKINKIFYLLMLPMQLELATGWGVMKWCPLVMQDLSFTMKKCFYFWK